MIFHGIAVKPGKPTAFALVDGRPFFGMPGNPDVVPVERLHPAGAVSARHRPPAAVPTAHRPRAAGRRIDSSPAGTRSTPSASPTASPILTVRASRSSEKYAMISRKPTRQHQSGVALRLPPQSKKRPIVWSAAAKRSDDAALGCRPRIWDSHSRGFEVEAFAKHIYYWEMNEAQLPAVASFVRCMSQAVLSCPTHGMSAPPFIWNISASKRSPLPPPVSPFPRQTRWRSLP